MSKKPPLPESLEGLSMETKLAVLYERVGTLEERVATLVRALWSLVFSILGGAILYLFSVSAGWVGPNKATAAKQLWGFISWSLLAAFSRLF